MLRLTAAARAFRHTHALRHASASADGTTSVLFSLKSVIFLSRRDGNVPTYVTASDHPSFIQKRERGCEEGRMRERERETDGDTDRHTSLVCIWAF